MVNVRAGHIYVPPDGRMDAKAAADYLGLAPKTLAMMRCAGTGPHFVKRGRIFYYRADCDTWLKEGLATTTAQSRVATRKRYAQSAAMRAASRPRVALAKGSQHGRGAATVSESNGVGFCILNKTWMAWLEAHRVVRPKLQIEALCVWEKLRRLRPKSGRRVPKELDEILAYGASLISIERDVQDLSPEEVLQAREAVLADSRIRETGGGQDEWHQRRYINVILKVYEQITGEFPGFTRDTESGHVIGPVFTPLRPCLSISLCDISNHTLAEHYVAPYRKTRRGR